MTRKLPRSGPLRILSITLFAAACTDGGEAPTAPDGSYGVQPTVVVDFQAGGGAQFVFFEPLVDGTASGPLATGLTPVVEICNVDPADPAPCIELDASENGDHYQANWRDRTVLPDETYTIRVTELGMELGKLSLTLDGVDGDEAGRTFPIKFWVGEDFAATVQGLEPCIDDDRCNADVVSDEEDDPVVITTEDEDGDVMAQLTFPPGSVPDGGLVVTLDCRTGGFDPGQGPLPTALDQWPVFCTVTVTHPDGTPFTGTLEAPATIDVCVVDNEVAGQAPYHDFDHDDLLLGKSNGAGDFEFLFQVASELEGCDGITTIPPEEAGLGNRILRELDSRLAPLFGFLVPEGLRAAPMYFRDGGVGGQVTSFSDINPVEPAHVEGTVVHVHGEGIEGVTVTLSLGETTLETAVTTGEDGAYAFASPLQAEEGGTTYTVTVSDLPDGVTISESSQDVLVTGTGTFTVDFVADLPEGIFFDDEGTENYYQAFSTPAAWETASSNAQQLDAIGSCSPHLATVQSPGEDAFIVTHMPQAAQAGGEGSSGNGGYWLGGLQPDGNIEPGEGWEWVFNGGPIPGTNDGEAYANWASTEPNNAGGGVDEGATNVENRLQYMGGWATVEGDETRWNDEPGGRSYGYVVEYECPIG